MKCPYCNGSRFDYATMLTSAPMYDSPKCPMCGGEGELTDEEFAIKAPLLHARELSDLSRQVGQLAATMRDVLFVIGDIKRSRWKIK